MLKKVSRQNWDAKSTFAPLLEPSLINTDDIVSVFPAESRGVGPFVYIVMRNQAPITVQGTLDDFMDSSAEQRASKLWDAIVAHHAQKADDRCIEDDDKLYAAAGLPPCDRRVGSKAEMLRNCERFLDNRCQEGGWPTYVTLEERIEELELALRRVVEAAPNAGKGETYQDCLARLKAEAGESLIWNQKLAPQGEALMGDPTAALRAATQRSELLGVLLAYAMGELSTGQARALAGLTSEQLHETISDVVRETNQRWLLWREQNPPNPKTKE